MRSKPVIFLFFLLFSGFALAQSLPVVSEVHADGAREHGDVVTIRGADFGAIDMNNFMLWDSVDNNPSYDAIADGEQLVPSVNSFWGSGDVMLDKGEGQRHAYSKAQYLGPGGNYFVGNPQRRDGLGFDYSTRDELYVSWWIKFDRNPFEVANNASHKLVRVWGGDSDDLRISWTTRNVITVSNKNAGSTGSKIAYSLLPGETLWPENQWHLMELWVSAKEGIVRGFVNGNLAVEWSDDSQFYLKTDHSGGPRVALLGFNPSHGEGFVGKTSFQMDGIAVSSTEARVLLSNSPTFSGLTAHEYQPVESWGGQEILVRLNMGGLDESSELYLYVVNDEGYVNEEGFLMSHCPTCPKRIDLQLE